MARKPRTPTLKIERTITSYIRAGGFAHVAAEAAGIPLAVFQDWLKCGEAPEATGRIRDFFIAVRQAEAQVRLGAEIQALKEKPMDWLKSGPGRETADRPGWTAPARPKSRAEEAPFDALQHPELQKMFAALMDVLAPFPDARKAVTEAISTPPVAHGKGRKRDKD